MTEKTDIAKDEADANGPSKTRAPGESARPPRPAAPVIRLPQALSVQRLADTMRASPINVIKQLMRRGVMANINQIIDYETAATITSDFGLQPEPIEEARAASTKPDVSKTEEQAQLQTRAPVVTILGHVDHGKTTLLDAIRKTSVTATEKGGITQHIGAYQVEVKDQKITFLDTPGHEAFTAMRARGAQVTDIAVLVVAADDGIMPQTREAIDHAKAADVPIVVAVNKIDLEGANQDRVKQQMTDLGMVPEEWGGDTIVVPVSAQTEEGIPDLLENLLLVAEISELKADPDQHARGVVIEAKLDTTKGPVATVLVQTGTLYTGDAFFVGGTRGKVRAMLDDHGEPLKEAGPSMPVEILGIDSVPHAGDPLMVDRDGKKADKGRRRRGAAAAQVTAASNMEQLMAQVSSGEAKELNVVLKTDVEGSAEAIRGALEKLESEKVKVKIIRTSSGAVSENDVMLASASNAMIMGFNTRSETGARRLADTEGVPVRFYDVIYNLIDDAQQAALGLLEPEYKEIVEAQAVVKEIFKVKSGRVAGIGVTEGTLARNALVRVVRNGARLHDSTIKSLQHYKDSVRELAPGTEGGIGVEGFQDFRPGDIVEAYRREEVKILA